MIWVIVILTIVVGLVLMLWPWVSRGCGVAGKMCRLCRVCAEGGPSARCLQCYGSGCSVHPRGL